MAFSSNREQLLASAVPYAARSLPRIGNTGMGPPYGATAVATYIQDMLSLGITMNRTYISWVSVNPSSGVYDWTNPDMWYAAMVAAGLTPIMQHIFAPNHWFTGVGTRWTHSDRPYADFPPYPGVDWDYFMARNVEAATLAAARYPLAIIEPQNEWNNAGIYCRPGGLVVACPVVNYAAFHAPIQAAIKAVNPTQKVIIGGLLRMDSAPVFSSNGNFSGNSALAPLKTALDALSCTPDGVSIHPYMLGAPNSDPTIDRGANIIGINSWQSVGRCLDEMDRIGWFLPVYITETGFRASQTNAQNAFNCNSQETKSLWNRYEHDAVYYLYMKQARRPGKSWVEAMMYYRVQEYPSPTATSWSGAVSGDPPEGPHTIYPWGSSLLDFTSRLPYRQPIPQLEGWTLNCPSTAVIGQPATAVSATGVGTGAIAVWHTSDASVIAVAAPTTGSSATTITFPGSGTATVWVHSYNACRLPIFAAQTITVAGQIPTLSVITPGNGWQVATSTGGTIQFTAAVTDQIGNPIVSPTGTWTSSDPTNAPIDAVTGLLTAVGVATGVVVTFSPTGGAPGSNGTSTGNVLLNPVLQITSGAVTLINVGETAVTVSDGTNPVTGCTLVISDGTKATVVGQNIQGKGTSGTFTVKAQKVGFDDSSLVTFTCSGGGYLDDKDTIGLSNGASVTTYTDVNGTTWAEATNPPTYATNDINGHAALVFNGTNQFLRAGATVSTLNQTGMTYAALVKPTNAAAATNEQMLDNRDTTVGNQGGFVLGRNATTFTSDLSYYTVVNNPVTQQFDGTAMATNSWVRTIHRIAQGAQSRMLDGALTGTSRTDAVYLNPTANPPRPTKGGSVFGVAGNNWQGHIAAEILVNRAVTDTERLQLDLRLKNYGAL